MLENVVKCNEFVYIREKRYKKIFLSIIMMMIMIIIIMSSITIFNNIIKRDNESAPTKGKN